MEAALEPDKGRGWKSFKVCARKSQYFHEGTFKDDSSEDAERKEES